MESKEKYQEALEIFKTYGGLCQTEFNYRHKDYVKSVENLQELIDIYPEYVKLKLALKTFCESLYDVKNYELSANSIIDNLRQIGLWEGEHD